MTSSSSPTPPQQADDARPAGGIIRSGGTRTPRRVQWASTDDVRVSLQPETSPRPSTHALDEKGLDPNALDTLMDALERYQSSERLESHPEGDREGGPSKLPALPRRAVLPLRSAVSAPAVQQNPFASPPPPQYPPHYASSNNPYPSMTVPQIQNQAAGVVRAHTRRGLGWLRHSSRAKATHKGEKSKGDNEEGKGKDIEYRNEHQVHQHTSSDTENETDLADTEDHKSSASEGSKGDGAKEDIKESHKSSLGRSLGSGSASSLLANLRAPFQPEKSSTAALIAGAGSLTGAAAPQQATLAPNLKRPGYGLVRYSMEDVPTVSRNPPVVPRAPRRTRSTDFDFTRAVGGRPDRGLLNPHGATTPGGQKRWSGVLKDLPHFSSGHFKGFSETHLIKEQARRERKERRDRDKEKRRKRKKVEVYITRHVAAILQRQEFIMKLARAMMMFGGPSHRLAAQIQSTGRVLDLQLNCMYLPDVMLISFEDSATGTSNVKFIRQGSALDLEKLGEAHELYWGVIHDAMSVSDASASLDDLMRKKPLYNFVQLIFIGGMCSASICSVSFSGSFIDSLAAAPLGALLVAIQLLSVRNELYGNVFEITVATLLSFLSAALADTKHFCYSAVASSSVVLILPGFIVLCGSLELASRSLVAGAVRLCFALMYSLFLGFGLSIGAELYEKIIGQTVLGATDYACVQSHDPAGPWWQQTPSVWWAFLTVPMYSLFLSLRLMAPWWKKELLLLIGIASVGWVTNHFVSVKFPNQSDISAAVGAFAVGFVSNMYGRFFNGNAFVVMLTGILFQVPSGLGNGGLLNFVSAQTAGSSSSYLSGFQTALQLISVAIGLTVGLGISLVIVHPVQSRRRAGGLFSL
ncbi:hypothetical protein BU15DRAFT_53866 [Melanogaster broomeanus]|nr:hypothetical protein BU15DRAFT_53866 [Melanogaster broomeanus]